MDLETGKRIREVAGIGALEAKEAWILKSHVLAGKVDDDQPMHSPPDNRTIDDAIEKFLVEVKDTKGSATLNANSYADNRYRASARQWGFDPFAADPRPLAAATPKSSCSGIAESQAPD